ncbi:MAG: alpha/beta hydrolase [Rhodospirillaceae bacterium]|jgi:non-heme chloroperoxidase|nr:alpha/beta hydrolase [Rhodospirillaceae bacterium]MBT5566055.1 alpha/beta hydrolase [Rhodospirillaceae bacterium]MBT6090031.1 alpha/beta hydrolase [Rhodospirillaceae bacterium]
MSRFVLSFITVLLVSYVGLVQAKDLVFSEVAGGGDIPLNVVEAGSPDGKEILFIHGVSQSYLSWRAQLASDQLQDFRMVAFDLRGHGNSAKPWMSKDYNDSALWAEDVAAVIAAKKLKNPVVVAWSYGGVVLMDYIRHYGTADIAAVNFVANTGVLIDRIEDPKSSDAELMSQMIANQARQQSPDIEENMASVKFAVPLLTETNLGDAWRQDAMMVTMMTPSYVRRALAGRKIDNKDLTGPLSDISFLLSYGAKDGSVTDPMSEKFRSIYRQTITSKYDGIGHSPFAEESERFNRELFEFVYSTGH